jgi:tetratricopeptide (TPR) repeat protein
MQAKDDLPRAIKSYEECARLCKRGHFFLLLLRTYNGLGNLYASIQDFDQALKIYQKALDLAVRLGDLTTKGALLYNQGFIYRRQDNYALAARRFLLAIQVLENKEKKLPIDINMLSKCYGGLAVISTLENSTLKALNYLMERVKFVQLSQAPAEEEFAARLDLAEAYLKTRLNDQFLREISELKKLAQSPEQLEKLANLEAEWKAVENFNTQDSTGRVQIVSVPN